MKLPHAILFPVLGACQAVIGGTSTPPTSAEGGAENHSRELRPWTIADSISVRYVVDTKEQGQYGPRGPHGDNLVVPSPDGKHFFFVTKRGDIATDSNVEEMSVFSTKDVLRELMQPRRKARSHVRPAQTATMRSARSDAVHAINDARWNGLGSIMFIGVEGAGPRRVYGLDVHTGTLQCRAGCELTGGQEVIRFDSSGDGMLCEVESPAQPELEGAYPIAAVAPNADLEQGFQPIDSRQLGSRYMGTKHSVWVRVGAGNIRKVAGLPGTIGYSRFLSPDGRWAIVIVQPEPPWPVSALSDARPKPSSADRHFVIIDLQTGNWRYIFETPLGESDYGRPQRALWSEDSQHAVLTNATLPQDENRGSNASRYIVDYEVSSGRGSIIEPMPPGNDRTDEIRWLVQGKELFIHHSGVEGGRAIQTVYSLRGGKWIGRSAPASVKPPPKSLPERLDGGLSVSVRQSANDPPVVIASKGTREVALIGPDPALIGVRRAAIHEVTWSEPGQKRGYPLRRPLRGGLMLPGGVNRKLPPPLVIQPYWWIPDKFLPDGISTSGYAAQVLTSKGMAVLQMDLPYGTYASVSIDSPEDYMLFVQRLEAAVDDLASRGLIDRERVGLIGEFVGGGDSLYALTHPGRLKVTTAVLANPKIMSLFNYLNGPTHDGDTRSNKDAHGGRTFWQAKAEWLEHDAVAHIDRIESPVLLIEGTPNIFSVMSFFRLKNAFLQTQRPMEAFILPQGDSAQLQRPRERQGAMQETVDWMSFWLLGQEDPAEDKTEKYARWRELKANWVRVQAEEAAERKSTTASGAPPVR
jgi:dipeptidyl aminopeptidase/acylaminoacyl peptidase